ncbi:hypothetical protein Q31b_51780 [Novipirellula aureliae]|uniref:Carboxypeptidase regulatory-like domain-containing protein n=1 Tax=Novipirellula aureliae TaxID=2527966 RepID=A0A5C6DES3_9BACT|nr:hypothetical protein [Novipirellula aureliae]TWU35743.1 hypothetical protein Q31b_51780 [Novipirellula aureliae]
MKCTQPLCSWCIVLILAGPSVCLSGCSGSEPDESFERVGVAGEVWIDGKPLEAGAIVFHCLDTAGETDRPVTSFAFIENGRYSIDPANGPAIGKAKVEFRPKPLDRQMVEASLNSGPNCPRPHYQSNTPAAVVAIPDAYGANTKLTVQLVAGNENHHDFQLHSRAR